MIKYACKVTSSPCLSQSFTAVHEDVPKCMPEECLPLSQVGSIIVGSNPTVCTYFSISPVVWFFCPNGHKISSHNYVQKTFKLGCSLSFGKVRCLSGQLSEQCKGNLVRERIPYYPQQSQKTPFRFVQEILKFSAVTFA